MDPFASALCAGTSLWAAMVPMQEIKMPNQFMRLCQSIVGVAIATSCVSTSAPSGDVATPKDPRETVLTGEDLVIIGDQGTGDGNQYAVGRGIVKWCETRTCDIGLTVGDNFYNMGVRSTLDRQWQTAFEQPYKDVAFRFYPVLGNHDYLGGKDSWTSELRYQSPRWMMPGRYYKLKTSSADIFAIDTMHFDGDQYKWLEAGLKAAANPWKIIYGHFPLYSSGPHGDTIVLHPILLPLLAKYKVDFYISGHDHDLELIQKDGVNHVISGAAGKLGPKFAWMKQHKDSVFAESVAGFAFLDFSEGSSVELSFVNAAGQTFFSRAYKK